MKNPLYGRHVVFAVRLSAGLIQVKKGFDSLEPFQGTRWDLTQCNPPPSGYYVLDRSECGYGEGIIKRDEVVWISMWMQINPVSKGYLVRIS